MTEPKNKAKISLKNIGRFLQGYSRMFSETFGLLEKHKQEQVIWRSEQAKECLKNGSCLYCGCDTPAKFYSDEACEDPQRQCYPSMMDVPTWEQYKAEHQITIKVD